MKKLFFWSLFFFPFLGEALYQGNFFAPSLIEKGLFLSDERFFNFRPGIVYTHVQNEKMEFSKKWRHLSYDLKEMQGNFTLVMLTLNLKERVDFSFQGGVGKWKEKFFLQNTSYKLFGENGTFWKGEGKWVVLERGNASLGLDAQYGIFRSGVEEIFSPSESFSGKGTLTGHQWQIGAGGSYQFHWICPYLGVSFRHEKMFFRKVPFFSFQSVRIRNHHQKGLFGGISFAAKSYFFLNAEYRWLNEKSLSISGEVRF